MRLGDYYRTVFWRKLPRRSYALLLVAVFFTFSTIGYINDIWNGGSLTIARLALSVVYAGVIGVGYGHGAMRDWRFIPLTAAIQLVVMLTIPDAGIHSQDLDPAVNSRLRLDGFGLLGSMIVGYVFFIVFISGQGMRHVRLRTEIELAREIHSVLVPPNRVWQPEV